MQKKTDFNTIIGLVLIGAILVYFSYTQRPDADAVEAATTEQVEEQQAATENNTEEAINNTDETAIADEARGSAELSDSLKQTAIAKSQGIFFDSTDIVAQSEDIILENDKIRLVIATKGGGIKQAELKEYKTHDSLPVYLVNNEETSMNLTFWASGKNYFSKDLYFIPTKKKTAEGTQLTMRLAASATSYIDYIYTLRDGDYLMDYTISTVGMEELLAINSASTLDWHAKARRQEKGKTMEQQNTALYYNYIDDEVDYLSKAKDDEEKLNGIKWVAFKQQFFSAVLVSSEGFDEVDASSKVAPKADEEEYTKAMAVSLDIEYKGGNQQFPMQLYFGPNKYDVLKSYDQNFDKLIPLGWGILGWINRGVVINIFSWLEHYGIGYGLIILILTVVIKLALSPITYKNFKSSAKMRVLKPEIEEINKKFEGKDAMQKQQATMALYKKAGVNPLAGCIPALLQMPILLAMFRFFPASIELRQQPFLWATDLSSFDTIATLPFDIPFYGHHVSLFTLLMAISMIFYTRMSSATMTQPSQPGMPNMKIIMYMMPVMMLFFFNNYPAGLSYYYLLANIISIGQMYVIKEFIIDEDKIHAQIQENKKKPKKKSGFQKRLEDMQRKQQEQLRNRKK